MAGINKKVGTLTHKFQWPYNGIAKQQELPGGYKQIPSLLCDGQEYISLQIPVSDLVEIRARVKTEVNTPQGLYGVIEGNNSYSALLGVGGYFKIGEEGLSVAPDYIGEKINIIQNKDGVQINDVSKGTFGEITPFQTTGTIYFGNIHGGTESGFIGRLYSLKLYNDGYLLLDLVPAKSIEDGTLGFYDLKYEQFYSNSGPGQFSE